MKSILVVIACLQTLYQVSLGVNCPDATLTPSCTCYVEHCQGRVHVQCNNISDPQSLKQQIRAYGNIPIGSFRVFDPEMTSLPDDLFQDICVQEIQIFRGQMKTLSGSNSPFPLGILTDCLTSLGVFMAYDFASWNWDILKPLNQLKVLKILSSPINQVPGAFGNVANGKLENISLCFANIDTIEDGAFSSFVNLMELRLSSNNIKTFPRTLLPPSPDKLELLDLKKNSIKTLEKNIFTKTPSLSKVDISYNSIESLPEETFKPIWGQIQLLNINGNPLNCDCNLKWLVAEQKSKRFANDFDKATCVKPPNLKGKIIANLTLTELVC